jgi:oligoribonuclease NrnB/cAMP/cGMP phosphodiesterase (DHH superfamily)
MKCFYHSADLDGHCSGAIVKMYYPECEMIGINYGQLFPWDSIEKGEFVFMVDFCLQPFDDMERLNSMCRLFWIDHHAKGSIDEAEKRDFWPTGGQKIDIGTAGCELAWEFFYPEKPHPFAVFYLGRYDVWDHSNPNTLPFQYGFRMFENTLPDNQSLWQSFFKDNSRINSVIEVGQIILAYEKQQNAKFCKAYAFETIMPGEPITNPNNISAAFRAICANRGFTNSKLFDSIFNPKKHDLMITFCRLKAPAGKWTVSLYSTKPEVDCGAIAKAFGGGGHKGAAGFQTDSLPFII